MSTPLPLTILIAPLPSDFEGTPQELADAIAERLSIETQESLALYGTGPVLPTSDEGPFLLNGTTWYVWDTGTMAYVPQTIEFQDDINPKPFRANAAAPQTIVFAAPGSDVLDLEFTQEYDHDVFGANTFVAPSDGYYNIKAKMGISATAGSPTDITIIFFLKKNTFQMPRELVFEELVNPASGRTYQIDSDIQLSAGDSISVAVQITIGGGTATWTITQNDTWFSGFKIRDVTW
jgi:hypothetical protein